MKLIQKMGTMNMVTSILLGLSLAANGYGVDMQAFEGASSTTEASMTAPGVSARPISLYYDPTGRSHISPCNGTGPHPASTAGIGTIQLLLAAHANTSCLMQDTYAQVQNFLHLCLNDCTCTTMFGNISSALPGVMVNCTDPSSDECQIAVIHFVEHYIAQLASCNRFTDFNTDELCEAAAQVLTPAVRMFTASGGPGLLFGILGGASYSNTSSTIGLMLKTIASKDSVWLNSQMLGEYPYCMAQEATTYCTAKGGIGPLSINVGLCVPAACDSTELSYVLANILNSWNISLSSAPEIKFRCTDDPATPFTKNPSAILSTMTLCIFVFLGILATGLDVLPGFVELLRDGPVHLRQNRGDSDDTELLLYNSDTFNKNDEKKNESFTRRALACFSMYRNFPKLMSTDAPKGSIGCLNGIRVLSMLWVILGHVFLIGMMTAPMKFPKEASDAIGRPDYQFISNAFFSVDSFFFMSGFLVCVGTLNKLKSMKIDSTRRLFTKFPLLQMYILRYLRLTPLYAVVLWFYSSNLQYMSSGPIYTQSIQPQVEPCKTNWWANLLFINNFYPKDFSNDQCMAWTWYMANDFQFFLVAPLFIFPLHFAAMKKSPVKTRGSLWLAISTLVFVAATFYISISVHMPGSPMSKRKSDDEPALGKGYPSEYYEKPWCRISVYLIGIYFAFLMKNDLLPKRIPATAFFAGWSLILGLGYILIWGLQGELQFTEPSLTSWSDPGPLADAFYNSLGRPVWALLLCMLVYFCESGYAGWINSFLSGGFWLPFARMSYATYMIHFFHLTIYFGSLEDDRNFVLAQLGNEFIGNSVVIFFFAFLFTLLVEFPFGGLVKLVLMKPKKSRLKEALQIRIPKHTSLN